MILTDSSRPVALAAAVLVVLGLACPPAVQEPAEAPAPPSPVEGRPAASGRPPPPKDTASGLYRASIRPLAPPVLLRTLHAWVVHLEDPAGAPVAALNIEVGGGMPDHGHGFPSRPRVTRYLGAGDHLVDGVQFNMEGRWRFTLAIDGPRGRDSASFDLEVRDLAGGAPAGRAALLASLALDALPPTPADPSNRVSLDPAAAALGEALFFDRRLGRDGEVACATCHDPARHFTDGRARARGLGDVARHTPTVLGVGHGSWFTWDGRRDSMWSHALTPLESLAEMGTTRVEAALYVTGHADHGPAYARVFGVAPPALPVRAAARSGPFAEEAAREAWSALPAETRAAFDVAFANIGKALDAYQRRLRPSPARFDRYVATYLSRGAAAADAVMSVEERAGLALFVDPDRTQCLRCHNGPLFTNHGFHNVGTGRLDGPPYDFGRAIGLEAARVDAFNCGSRFSDAGPGECAALDFAGATGHDAVGLRGAFKVPTLRNVAQTAPYLHDGRFAELAEVIEHYRNPPPMEVARHELMPTDLTDEEAQQLVAFLGTLGPDVPPEPASR